VLSTSALASEVLPVPEAAEKMKSFPFEVIGTEFYTKRWLDSLQALRNQPVL
jgi:hypothetical protein